MALRVREEPERHPGCLRRRLDHHPAEGHGLVERRLDVRDAGEDRDQGGRGLEECLDKLVAVYA